MPFDSRSTLSSIGPTRWAWLVGGALLVCAPAGAWAGVKIEVQEVRSFALPEDLNVGRIQVETNNPAMTVLHGPGGSEEEPSCVIVAAEGDSAVTHTYQYASLPTLCMSVLPKPGGGFFVRGIASDDPEALVIGFTAFLDATGTQVWAVHDQALLDAESRADGGTGTFLGAYLQPHNVLAYSARFDRLMAFTVGELNIGPQPRPITQAHVMNGTSGRIRISGQTFGQSGVGYVADARARESDGYFLLYVYHFGSEGAYFFTYNGDEAVKAYKPRDEDWSKRFVLPPVQFGADSNVHLLWTPPTSESSTATNVTVVNTEAAEVYSSVWPSRARLVEDLVVGPDFVPIAKGSDIELGPAQALIVGQEHSVLVYRASHAGSEPEAEPEIAPFGYLMLRVIETATGRAVGLAPIGGLTEHTFKIIRGQDGALNLLVIDNEFKIHEYELRFTDTGPDDEGPMTGDDVGAGSDVGVGVDIGVGVDVGVGSDTTSDGEDDQSARGRSNSGGCACSNVDGPSQSAPLLAMILGALLFASRRRARR
ncbi:MAG: hypothetical protein H0U74_21745 [Bradymonadaceae bacterium]|nr:hypothetical protein [Lujinxingiaceae bacterium]